MKQLLAGFLAFVSAQTVTPTIAVAQSQLRFKISPIATDSVWKAQGITFEKRGLCRIVKSTAVNPAIPTVAEIVTQGTAKAPVFNPGTPQPNGTYASTPDDGFNTLFVPLVVGGDPNAYMSCTGSILANGKDVTLATRSGATTARIGQIAQSGPLTVSPGLDLAKLQAVAAALRPPVLKSGTTTTSGNGGSFTFTSGFDLDSGSITAQGGEIFVSKVYATAAYLYNKALVQASADGDGGGLDTRPCGQSSTADFPVIIGKTACLRTTEGKYARIRLDSIVPNGQQLTARFSYVIWNPPISR